MTIDKAILILEALYRGGMSPKDPNPKEAFKLGSEALQRIQQRRALGIPEGITPLPSEVEITGLEEV